MRYKQIKKKKKKKKKKKNIKTRTIHFRDLFRQENMLLENDETAKEEEYEEDKISSSKSNLVVCFESCLPNHLPIKIFMSLIKQRRVEPKSMCRLRDVQI